MILVYHSLFNHLPVEEVSSFGQMEIIKLKNTITKIKTQRIGLIYSRVEITEDRISDLKDRSIKFTQFEQRENKIEKKKKTHHHQQSLRDLWDHNKRANIHTILSF